MRFGLVFLAGIVGVVAAQGTSGNAFSEPERNAKIPAGKPFTVQWKPDTPGPISLDLLNGATQQSLQVIASLAKSTANSGSFEWTPETSLPAGGIYGIRLTDLTTKQVQYTDPFSVVGSTGSGSSASGSGSISLSATSSGSGSTSSSAPATTHNSTVTAVSTTSTSTSTTVSTLDTSTTAASNFTSGGIAVPSNTAIVSAEPTVSASSTAPTASTGAAAANAARLVGSGLLGVAGVMAWML